MLNTDQHNATRLRFLSRFDDWISTPDSVQEKGQIRLWILGWMDESVKTLRVPQMSERNLLLACAQMNGGIKFLKDQ